MSAERLDLERREELVTGHLLGALDAADQAEFEELLLSGDPELMRLLEEFGPAADALLLAAPGVAPPADLKRRILGAAGMADAVAPQEPAGQEAAAAAESGAEPGAGPPHARRASDSAASSAADSGAPRTPRRSDFMKMTPRGRAERNWVLTGLALAAAAGLAIVSWQALNLNHRAETAAEALADAQHTIEGLKSELEGVKATAARQAELVRLLAEPNSGLITLAALAPAPGASARVLWDPTARKGYLWVRNLPPEAQDKDYQLWALAGQTPMSAGVFSVGADGTALVPLDTLALPPEPIGAFAITLEPAGGLPAPTGAILLMGSVTG